MTDATPTPPPTFDCRARRHKVLAGDGICVLCGSRGVIDARHLPPPASAPLPLRPETDDHT